MDEDGTQTVNIKGIVSKEWEKARGIATRNGESMGAYTSRALAQLAEREAGERFFPPERFDRATPPDLPPSIPLHQANPLADFEALAGVLRAMKEADIPIQGRVKRAVNAVVHDALRGPPKHRLRQIDHE